MSKNPAPRILAFVCCALMIPFGLVIVIFEIVGIGDIIYPILIPIIVGTAGFIIIIFTLVFFGVRCATNVDSTSKLTGRRHITHTYTPPHTPSRPVFQIPMNCPNCQRAIEPDRVEWRDSHTIVCPGCFADIQVETSHER